MDVANVGRADRLHGVAAAGRQRAVHDGDGDEDALRRPRLKILTTGGAPGHHRSRGAAAGARERARPLRRASCCVSRRGGDRQDAARRRGRGGGAGLARPARRVRRVRRRGARLRAGRRGAARPARGLAGGLARRALRRGARRAGGGAAARGGPAAARRGGCSSCCSTCSAGSATAPVLLVLEDIHWADRSTLALLAFLARNLRSERIVVLATYRVDDELPPALRRLASELRRRRTVLRIELEPLPRDDVARQLEAIAGGPVAAALVDEVHARAGGNPFFVEELFAAPRRRQPATVAEARRCARVEAARRRARSTRDARRGRRGGARRTRCSSGSAVAPDALREALDAGVLVRERDGVAFRHGLIGEVVYERLLPAERAQLHRAIAAAPRRPRAARAPLPPRGPARGGARGFGRGRDRGRAGVRLRRGERALRARARAVGPTSRRPRRPARPRRAGRALQRRPGAGGRALPRGDRARARPRPPRAALRAPRRVPLLGRRGGAASATSRRSRSRPASRGCSPPRATR